MQRPSTEAGPCPRRQPRAWAPRVPPPPAARHRRDRPHSPRACLCHFALSFLEHGFRLLLSPRPSASSPPKGAGEAGGRSSSEKPEPLSRHQPSPSRCAVGGMGPPTWLHPELQETRPVSAPFYPPGGSLPSRRRASVSQTPPHRPVFLSLLPSPRAESRTRRLHGPRSPGRCSGHGSARTLRRRRQGGQAGESPPVCAHLRVCVCECVSVGVCASVCVYGWVCLRVCVCL